MTMDAIVQELRQVEQRTRQLEAALRVARGYVLKDGTPQAERDLVALDAALAKPGGVA